LQSLQPCRNLLMILFFLFYPQRCGP
jgi:hypothetical protein